MANIFFSIQRPGDEGKFWSKEDLPLMEKEEIKEYLRKLAVHKLMAPDRIAPRSIWGADWLWVTPFEQRG